MSEEGTWETLSNAVPEDLEITRDLMTGLGLVTQRSDATVADMIGTLVYAIQRLEAKILGR